MRSLIRYVTASSLAVGLLALVALGPGCASTSGEGGGDTEMTGKSGSVLWSEKCASCHNHRQPGSLSDAEWNVVVRHMRVRAKLNGADETKIREFLQSGN